MRKVEAAIELGKQPGQTEVNINQVPRGANGQNPLMMAIIASGRIEIVEALIQAGADLNHRDENGYSMLDIACIQGRDEIVAMLLDKGADPAAAGPDGWAPIQRAANGQSPRYEAALKMIIEHDKKLASYVDSHGVPIILYARTPGPRQVLLDAGACAPSWFSETDVKDSCIQLTECGAAPRLSGFGDDLWKGNHCRKLLADVLQPTPHGLGGQELQELCPCSCGTWVSPPLCDAVPESEMIGTEASQREHWHRLLSDDGSRSHGLTMVLPNGLNSKKPKMIPQRGA